MDSLWVLILFLVAFFTIVTVRIFRNGAREEPEAAGFEAPVPAETPARPRRPSRTAAAAPAAAPAALTSEEAATPARARSRRAARQPAAPTPAVWPGGDCPNCGSPTVPSAKFCGECGRRLVP